LKAGPRRPDVVKRRKTSNQGAAPGPDSENESPPAAAAYAPVINAGFQATASRVQEMHQAISGKTFDNLLRMPGLSVPTRIVQGVHDAITQGVYAAVRHGGGAAMSLAAAGERLVGDSAQLPGSRLPGVNELALRSVLNGAVGDSMAAAGNSLAIQMRLHARGAPLAATPESLASLRPRVCVFMHGLACDEQSWGLRTTAWAESPWADASPGEQHVQYGVLLERELGVSAIYLRYNTGLSIDSNAELLAALLERTAKAAPQVDDWTLIGHSMGGLVARRAHQISAAQGMQWSARVPMIICLGSPNQGAPLEKLAHLATAALSASKVTRPLGQMANARSQGIKDLRRGLKGRVKSVDAPPLRLVYATLGDESNAGMGPFIGKVLGDGLVMAESAADDGATGDVQRVEIAGLGHMGLLNHPRVYAVIRRWLGAPEVSSENASSTSPDTAP
jgi:pimeloyl-ACP methyl ester carboxylesterase